MDFPDLEETLIVIALVSSILIAVGSFAWGYWSAGYDGITYWMIAFGFLWLVAQWRRWRWVSTAGVILALLLAIFGVWFNLIVGWMFSGAIFALFAWDLTKFRHALLFANARDDISGMTRRHIARISFLALAGMLVASLLMYIRGQFTVEWGVFFLGVFMLGSLQTVAWLGRPGD